MIGALIALAGTVFVQLWLVPRVDTRKRREQRWEEDVLALGQLLTFDQPRIVSDLRSELHMLALLLDPPHDVDTTTERWSALGAEHQEKRLRASEEFRSLRTRVDWLVDRVLSLAPHARPLELLGSQWRNYYLRYVQIDMLEWQPAAGDEQHLDAEEIDAVFDALNEVTRQIVQNLKRLATVTPPRNPPARHTRKLVSDIRARLEGKRSGS